MKLHYLDENDSFKALPYYLLESFFFFQLRQIAAKERTIGLYLRLKTRFSCLSLLEYYLCLVPFGRLSLQRCQLCSIRRTVSILLSKNPARRLCLVGLYIRLGYRVYIAIAIRINDAFVSSKPNGLPSTMYAICLKIRRRIFRTILAFKNYFSCTNNLVRFVNLLLSITDIGRRIYTIVIIFLK